MSAKPDVDFSEDILLSLGVGLLFKAVCAPASWDADRVSEEATKNDHPGTSANRWFVTDVDSLDAYHAFKSGNPQQCPDCADRRHWLVNC